MSWTGELSFVSLFKDAAAEGPASRCKNSLSISSMAEFRVDTAGGACDRVNFAFRVFRFGEGVGDAVVASAEAALIE